MSAEYCEEIRREAKCLERLADLLEGAGISIERDYGAGTGLWVHGPGGVQAFIESDAKPDDLRLEAKQTRKYLGEAQRRLAKRTRESLSKET